MKTFVRAFVIVLTLTGAAASTRTSAASARTIASSVQPKMFPVPVCPPDGSKGDCGIGTQQSGK